MWAKDPKKSLIFNVCLTFKSLWIRDFLQLSKAKVIALLTLIKGEKIYYLIFENYFLFSMFLV